MVEEKFQTLAFVLKVKEPWLQYVPLDAGQAKQLMLSVCPHSVFTQPKVSLSGFDQHECETFVGSHNSSHILKLALSSSGSRVFWC